MYLGDRKFVIANNNYNPEKEIISLFLTALGFKKNHTVYLRGFYPSDDSRKSGDAGRKGEAKTLPSLIKIVAEWQNEGRGVYLVVNGGGHSDADVVKCRAVFYEHDNLDKDIQRDLWQSLGLPQPSIQVDTGGKSIHSYWLLDEQIGKDEWKQLQTDLLNYADADRALKNPSRVMRLPGCFHFSKEGANLSTIISNSGNKYSYQELRNIIPQKQKAQPSIPLDFSNGEVPLYQCLSKDDRSLIDAGAGIGERNQSGAKLVRNLIGTAARLTHLGYRYDGHPRTLFDNFCDRCSPPLDARESDRIWRSAQKDNPTATLSDDALENCVKAWQRQQRGEMPGQSKKVESKSDTTKLSSSQLISELNLIDRELPEFELEAFFPELSDRFGRSTNDIRRTYEALIKERQVQEDREESRRKVPELLESQQLRINPFSLFYGDGGKFAQSLVNLSEAMPTPVEHLITTLIPAVGSRMGAKTQIVVKSTAGYTQPPVFWSCVVAQKGQKKTPTQKAILNPLFKLEDEEFQKWEPKHKQYKEDLKNYKKNSGDELPIEPPPRARYVVQDATSETRIKIHCENPRGLLTYLDEWSSFTNSRNMYRGGKGNDLERDLSEFNGGTITKDTTAERLFLYKSAISRTGATQPETLNYFLNSNGGADNQAEYARWLFCMIPSTVAYLNLSQEDDGSAAALERGLTSLYKNVGMMPEKDYFLTHEAFQTFEQCHDRLTDAYLAESNGGVSGAYPKLQSYLCRLTLWVHIVNSALAGENAPQMISPRAVSAACELVRFYESQVKLLFNLNDSGSLTGDLLKVKQFIDRRDGIAIRDIKQNLFCFKKTAASLLTSICDDLVKMGVVKNENKKYYSLTKTTNITNKVPASLTPQAFDPVVGTTNIHQQHQQKNVGEQQNGKMDFSENTKNVGDVVDLLVDHQHTQSHAPQELQAFVGDVGGILVKNENQSNSSTAVTTYVESESIQHVDHLSYSVTDEVSIAEPAQQIAPQDLTYDPAANAELLREALHAECWEMITELTEEWPAKFKKQVWAFLSINEQEAIRDMKPVKSDKIPVFLAKDVYYSESLKSKVIVHTIYDNDQECGCTIVGKKGIYSLKFHDLKFSPESPYIECVPLDKVEISWGDKKGQIGIVTSVMPGGPIFVKSERTNKPLGKPYFAHQLIKI